MFLGGSRTSDGGVAPVPIDARAYAQQSYSPPRSISKPPLLGRRQGSLKPRALSISPVISASCIILRPILHRPYRVVDRRDKDLTTVGVPRCSGHTCLSYGSSSRGSKSSTMSIKSRSMHEEKTIISVLSFPYASAQDHPWHKISPFSTSWAPKTKQQKLSLITWHQYCQLMDGPGIGKPTS